MQRIVVAPQSFKGSLSAPQVAQAIAAGIRALYPDAEIVQMALADGGEGTVETLVSAIGGERRTTEVEGPLGDAVKAQWAALADGRAAIEMAAASGLPLLPAWRRHPLAASTFGTGQLIHAALDAGAAEILVGLGGSATNDGGAGALQALGLRLLDESGRELPRGGQALTRLSRVDASELDRRLGAVRLRVMSDVTNPLCGPQGATAVFGPQKGVTAEMVEQLDGALARWAEVLARDLGKDVRDAPGAGAAGGLGAALLALGASLEPGAELLLDLVGFDRQLTGASLVITGEGRLDGQSVHGKTTVAVARHARAAGVRVLAIVGSLGPDYAVCYAEGIDGVMPIVPGPMTLDQAASDARSLITDATRRALELARLGQV